MSLQEEASGFNPAKVDAEFAAAQLTLVRGDGVNYDLLKDANAINLPQDSGMPDSAPASSYTDTGGDMETDGLLFRIDGKLVMHPNRSVSGHMNGPERDSRRYGDDRFPLGTIVKQQLVPEVMGKIIGEEDFTQESGIGEYCYLVQWQDPEGLAIGAQVRIPRSQLYRHNYTARIPTFRHQKSCDKSEKKCANGWTVSRFHSVKTDQIYSMGGQAVRVLQVDYSELDAWMPKARMTGGLMDDKNDAPFWRMEDLDRETSPIKAIRDAYIVGSRNALLQRAAVSRKRAFKVANTESPSSPKKEKKSPLVTNLFSKIDGDYFGGGALNAGTSIDRGDTAKRPVSEVVNLDPKPIVEKGGVATVSEKDCSTDIIDINKAPVQLSPVKVSAHQMQSSTSVPADCINAADGGMVIVQTTVAIAGNGKRAESTVAPTSPENRPLTSAFASSQPPWGAKMKDDYVPDTHMMPGVPASGGHSK